MEFVSARFSNFVDDKKYDVALGGYVDGKTEFETIKEPRETARCKRFIPVFLKSRETPGALRTAGFYPVDDSKVLMLNKMYELRQAIDAKDEHKACEHSERLAILQDSIAEDDLLSRIHGKLMDRAWNEIPAIR